MLIVWQKALSGKNSFDGCIDIREIKEVRRGKNSRDFDKSSDETSGLVAEKCFVIYYGSEFNLQCLSIVTLGVEECSNWIKGLKYLMQDAAQATYGLTLQRWFRKCFYEMEQPGKEGTISFQARTVKRRIFDLRTPAKKTGYFMTSCQRVGRKQTQIMISFLKEIMTRGLMPESFVR